MKCVVLVGLLLVACDGGESKPLAPAELAKLAPAVSSPDVLAKVKARPPVVVFVEADRRPEVAVSKTWEALGRGVFARGPVKTSPHVAETIYYVIREDAVMQRFQYVQVLKRATDNTLELASLEDCGMGGLNQRSTDDPPAEEEDAPEVGTQETHDPSRQKGRGVIHGRCSTLYSTNGRLARRIGEVDADRQLEDSPAFLLAPPSVPAALLVDAIEHTAGHIGVVHAGTLHPLAIDFRDAPKGHGPRWIPVDAIELRITTSEIRAVPATSKGRAAKTEPAPVTVELATLAKSLSALRAELAFEADVPIDVLVDDKVSSQRFVDLLVALIEAKQTVVGVGRSARPLVE